MSRVNSFIVSQVDLLGIGWPNLTPWLTAACFITEIGCSIKDWLEFVPFVSHWTSRLHIYLFMRLCTADWTTVIAFYKASVQYISKSISWSRMELQGSLLGLGEKKENSTQSRLLFEMDYTGCQSYREFTSSSACWSTRASMAWLQLILQRCVWNVVSTRNLHRLRSAVRGELVYH